MSKNIAIIPARGGSKGVPLKNIRPLCGKPLIVWSIEQALAARAVDQVFVSTDHAEIAEISQKAGARVIWRPEALSGDTASSESAISHALDTLALEHIQPDYVYFLQCTSPLRHRIDLDAAFEKLTASGADSLLTVVPSHAFIWQQDSDGFGRASHYDPAKRPRRQDMQPQFRENGSFYIFSRANYQKYGNRLGGKIALYEMDEASAMEIDSVTDFEIVEILMQRFLASELAAN